MNEPIIITLSGGVVQDVENVPKGFTVELRDYDIDNADAIQEDGTLYDDYARDEDGDIYFKGEW